jgi:hypothetical protein
MRRSILVCLVVMPMLSLTACSSGPKAYIPVDSPLRTWQPPESDAYAPEPAAAPKAQAPAAAAEKAPAAPAAAAKDSKKK